MLIPANLASSAQCITCALLRPVLFLVVDLARLKPRQLHAGTDTDSAFGHVIDVKESGTGKTGNSDGLRFTLYTSVTVGYFCALLAGVQMC